MFACRSQITATFKSSGYVLRQRQIFMKKNALNALRHLQSKFWQKGQTHDNFFCPNITKMNHLVRNISIKKFFHMLSSITINQIM